jgi:hypothetical protein
MHCLSPVNRIIESQDKLTIPVNLFEKEDSQI